MFPAAHGTEAIRDPPARILVTSNRELWFTVPAVRALVHRSLRVAIVAGIAAALYFVLEPYGLAWWVLPLAVVGTLIVAWRRWRALRLGRRAERWADAVLDPAARPAAEREVRAELDRIAAADRTRHPERVRLTVLLAELLDAAERLVEAEALLLAVPIDDLPPVDAGVLRHGRAVLRLRAGDPAGARDVLREGPLRTGAPELDLRLELLDASAGLELGEAERALETATSVRRRAASDEALVVEARVVRAAALDALGNREDALAVLRTFGPELIDMLEKLGQPRVRALAGAARGGGRR